MGGIPSRSPALVRVLSVLSVAALSVAAAVTAGVACNAARAETPVDLELILAIDVSRSIDREEARLQRQGYIDAFRDPELIRAIGSGFIGKIAVGYFEWAGIESARIVLPWTLIDGEKGARAFADALSGSKPPGSARRTSISHAIDFALPWFDGNGFAGTRRVIDVSGDGPNNDGDLVTLAREKALAAGVTINGLPIMGHSRGLYSRFNLPDLDLYFRDCVIGGPGAFLEVAADFPDFARAVRRKLILEIAGRTPRNGVRVLPAQAGPGARIAPPCNIGEQILLRYEDP
ncbi:MAG: DUF1194 domain-containing protein [Alphaproteobacteria bacterium]